MTDRAHGTRAKYVGDRCRCVLCRLANGAYQNARSELQKRREPYILAFAPETRKYVVRLRDEPEIVFRSADRLEAFAHRNVLNKAAAEKIAQEPIWANACLLGKVRKHIARLQASGTGIRQASLIKGLNRGRLMEIAHGRGNREDRPSRVRIRHMTAVAILSIPPTPADGANVPAGDTWVLLDEMVDAGVRKAWIAAALGLKRPALQIKRSQVRQSTAVAVRALYERFERGEWPMTAQTAAVVRPAENPVDRYLAHIFNGGAITVAFEKSLALAYDLNRTEIAGIRDVVTADPRCAAKAARNGAKYSGITIPR